MLFIVKVLLALILYDLAPLNLLASAAVAPVPEYPHVGVAGLVSKSWIAIVVCPQPTIGKQVINTKANTVAEKRSKHVRIQLGIWCLFILSCVCQPWV
jgi:hypothetical protein